MVLGIGIFLLCGHFLNSVVGFVVYIVIITVLCLILDRTAFMETVQMGKDMVLSKFKKKR